MVLHKATLCRSRWLVFPNANATTYGNTIVFRPGCETLGTLVHELVHGVIDGDKPSVIVVVSLLAVGITPLAVVGAVVFRTQIQGAGKTWGEVLNELPLPLKR